MNDDEVLTELTKMVRSLVAIAQRTNDVSPSCTRQKGRLHQTRGVGEGPRDQGQSRRGIRYREGAFVPLPLSESPRRPS